MLTLIFALVDGLIEKNPPEMRSHIIYIYNSWYMVIVMAILTGICFTIAFWKMYIDIDIFFTVDPKYKLKVQSNLTILVEKSNFIPHNCLADKICLQLFLIFH